MKLITYTSLSDTDNESIEKIIRSQKYFARINNNTWVVGGKLCKKQIRDLIIPFAKKVYVFGLDGIYAGYG